MPPVMAALNTRLGTCRVFSKLPPVMAALDTRLGTYRVFSKSPPLMVAFDRKAYRMILAKLLPVMAALFR